MKARKKPIEEIGIEELGVDVSPNIEYLSVLDPPKREGGIKVESVQELFDKLRESHAI